MSLPAGPGLSDACVSWTLAASTAHVRTRPGVACGRPSPRSRALAVPARGWHRRCMFSQLDSAPANVVTHPPPARRDGASGPLQQAAPGEQPRPQASTVVDRWPPVVPGVVRAARVAGLAASWGCARRVALLYVQDAGARRRGRPFDRERATPRDADPGSTASLRRRAGAGSAACGFPRAGRWLYSAEADSVAGPRSASGAMPPACAETARAYNPRDLSRTARRIAVDVAESDGSRDVWIADLAAAARVARPHPRWSSMTGPCGRPTGPVPCTSSRSRALLWWHRRPTAAAARRALFQGPDASAGSWSRPDRACTRAVFVHGHARPSAGSRVGASPLARNARPGRSSPAVVTTRHAPPSRPTDTGWRIISNEAGRERGVCPPAVGQGGAGAGCRTGGGSRAGMVPERAGRSSIARGDSRSVVAAVASRHAAFCRSPARARCSRGRFHDQLGAPRITTWRPTARRFVMMRSVERAPGHW